MRAFMLLPLLVISCSQNQNSARSEVRLKSRMESGVPVGVPTVVPGPGGEPSCETFSAAQPLCDWACLHDAVFVGEILAVEAGLTPATVGGSDTAAASCSTELLPALEVRVAVLDAIRGTLPSELTVVMPRAAAEHWRPLPMLSEGNAISWQGATEDVPFQAGTVVGIRASLVGETGRWSTGFEAAFTFSKEWLPVFPAQECVEAIELEGNSTYTSFRETVEACPVSEYCVEARENWDGLSEALRLGARCANRG